MQCLVSVLMPVYNAKDYLQDTTSSILNESSKDFELILIDDGSTDGSSAICDQIAQQDSRVRVIHKKNGGMCQARNIGILEAKGKWIAFSDNDDAVLPGFIDKNLPLAQKYDCDCLVFGREWVQIDHSGLVQYTQEQRPETEKCIYGEEIMSNYFRIMNISDAVWVRFFKRSMLIRSGITFDESFRSGYEDSLFNDMVLEHAESYAFNPHCYYRWLHRASHSTSMKISKNRYESLSKTIHYEYTLMKGQNLLEDNRNKCGELIFSRLFDIIATNHLASGCTFEIQSDVYETIRQIAKPYSDLLEETKLRPDLEIAKKLLLSKKNRLLFYYLQAGTKAKMAVNRLNS